MFKIIWQCYQLRAQLYLDGNDAINNNNKSFIGYSATDRQGKKKPDKLHLWKKN